MILYFTGTGNSKYVATRIAKEIGEEAYNLFSRIREDDHSQLHSETPWIVVVPTYAWRIPRILEKKAGAGTIGGKQKYLLRNDLWRQYR